MEAKEINRTCMVAAAMEGRAETRMPQARALVTVFTYGRAGVPEGVMVRAKPVATAAFAAAGINPGGRYRQKSKSVYHRRIFRDCSSRVAPAHNKLSMLSVFRKKEKTTCPI
jgi:hypothetical protein